MHILLMLELWEIHPRQKQGSRLQEMHMHSIRCQVTKSLTCTYHAFQSERWKLRSFMCLSKLANYQWDLEKKVCFVFNIGFTVGFHTFLVIFMDHCGKHSLMFWKVKFNCRNEIDYPYVRRISLILNLIRASPDWLSIVFKFHDFCFGELAANPFLSEWALSRVNFCTCRSTITTVDVLHANWFWEVWDSLEHQQDVDTAARGWQLRHHCVQWSRES